MTPGAVVVAGAVARRQWAGGHVWALLHWVLAFRRLGWNVTFLDRVDPGGAAATAPEIFRFFSLMRRFGLQDSVCLEIGSDRSLGLGRAKLLERVRDADLLLNVMGYCTDPDVLGAARLRVFLDIDPGFGQMWKALGQADLFRGHDRFVTVGARLGGPDCSVPSCGLEWIPTLPPVDLGSWPATERRGRSFSSVVTWRGPFDPIQYAGRRYGLRVHEFRRFVGLPARTGLPFELALSIDPSDEPDRARLEAEGWTLLHPGSVVGGPDGYREYVRASGAEFQIAKNMYVEARTGWFSDRTACYLASGRPAVVQDTGLDGVIETGRGLLRFATPDEAAAATLEVAARWERHALAARELAEAYLDSDRVMEALLPRIAAA